MTVYSKSDIGLRRNTNQDYCVTGEFSDGAVWAAVCDGMGGANGGSTASRMAAETIEECLCGGYSPDISSVQIKALMQESVREANHRVYEASLNVPGLSGMGTTVVCAVARDGMVHVVHAGDSRAYLYSNDEIRQITKDHSIVQELVDLGRFTAEEARFHPHKNIITRALGTQPELPTDYNTAEFSEASKLLICTDGLSNYLTDPKLLEYMRNTEDCGELSDSLIEAAKELGGSDNITVALIIA